MGLILRVLSFFFSYITLHTKITYATYSANITNSLTMLPKLTILTFKIYEYLTAGLSLVAGSRRLSPVTLTKIAGYFNQEMTPKVYIRNKSDQQIHILDRSIISSIEASHSRIAGFSESKVSQYTLFFYKNIFYKNIEAEICEILRIFLE